MSLLKTPLPLGAVSAFPLDPPTTLNPPYQELEALEHLLRSISNELTGPTIPEVSMTDLPTGSNLASMPDTPVIAVKSPIAAPETPVSASTSLSSLTDGRRSTASATPISAGSDGRSDSELRPAQMATPLIARSPTQRERTIIRGLGNSKADSSGATLRSASSGSGERSSKGETSTRSEKSSQKGEKRAIASDEVRRERKRERHEVAKMERPEEKDGERAIVKLSAQQEFIRTILLYLVPVITVIPIALVLTLTRVLLTPLYNSMPLALHTHIVYLIYFLGPTFAYWRLTSRCSARELISARVCLSISALGADLVAVGGRRTGSLLGQYFGAQWGALMSLGVLGAGVVGGGLCFALLCFDHIWPVPRVTLRNTQATNLLAIGIRSAIYLVHVFYAEKACNWALRIYLASMIQRPEKTILLLSLIMTVLSFFLRSSTSQITFARRVSEYYLDRKDLTPASRKKFADLANRLPSDLYPILIALRLPLLVLILRQQIYLHPVTPYVTADGSLRILHSEQSLTGQIVIAENLKDGYRFMRCDHSILGGRWTREIPDGQGGTYTDMGDSIFGCFSLQEIGTLAHRSDISDSIGRTLALTTDLGVSNPVEPEKPEERALIIGLGVGIAAAAFARKGYEVDIVEIDPAVYNTAATHFNLSNYPISTVNLLSGSTYIHHLADLSRQKTIGEDGVPVEGIKDFTKWSLVVQDCFSGGSVPGEMFTLQFWRDLSELVERDGIVAMNFVGLRGSRASRAVLVTLLSVFEQCRAFSDGSETDAKQTDIRNMVVFCTMTHSPLLTFRPPTAQDVMRSPMRSHVYSTFHPNEIQLDTIIQDSDWLDPDMMLTQDNFANLDKWQIDTALATWKAMSKILTPEMWLAW